MDFVKALERSYPSVPKQPGELGRRFVVSDYEGTIVISFEIFVDW